MGPGARSPARTAAASTPSRGGSPLRRWAGLPADEPGHAATLQLGNRAERRFHFSDFWDAPLRAGKAGPDGEAGREGAGAGSSARFPRPFPGFRLVVNPGDWLKRAGSVGRGGCGEPPGKIRVI